MQTHTPTPAKIGHPYNALRKIHLWCCKHVGKRCCVTAQRLKGSEWLWVSLLLCLPPSDHSISPTAFSFLISIFVFKIIDKRKKKEESHFLVLQRQDCDKWGIDNSIHVCWKLQEHKPLTVNSVLK